MQLFVVAMTIAVATASFAQDRTANGTPRNRPAGFSVGYFGYQFANPGFQLGTEFYLATTRNFNVIGNLNFFFFDEPGVQSAMALNARIGQRVTAGFGLFLESCFGIGVQQSFFDVTTYDYSSDDQATISTKSDTMTGALPHLTVGIGYDFTRKTKLPIKYYLQSSFYMLYPDQNSVFQTSWSMETGIIFVPTLNRKTR
jgi:hypothetical protein